MSATLGIVQTVFFHLEHLTVTSSGNQQSGNTTFVIETEIGTGKKREIKEKGKKSTVMVEIAIWKMRVHGARRP